MVSGLCKHPDRIKTKITTPLAKITVPLAGQPYRYLDRTKVKITASLVGPLYQSLDRIKVKTTVGLLLF
jgi:hypothetical protein